MAGNFFRGTSVEQDGRWGKSDERLMSKMASKGMFASILNTKVNIKKINVDVISKWITQKVIEVLGFEDDIVINLIINMLQGDVIDGKQMQLGVTGFLEKKAPSFMEELWTLLVDAQSQSSGIPSVFINRKKEEILQRQASAVHTSVRTTRDDHASMAPAETVDSGRDDVDSRDRSRDRALRRDDHGRKRIVRDSDSRDRNYRDRNDRNDDRDDENHRSRHRSRHDKDEYRNRIDRNAYRDNYDSRDRNDRGGRHRAAKGDGEDYGGKSNR